MPTSILLSSTRTAGSNNCTDIPRVRKHRTLHRSEWRVCSLLRSRPRLRKRLFPALNHLQVQIRIHLQLQVRILIFLQLHLQVKEA
jgi:hypothetical protein